MSITKIPHGEPLHGDISQKGHPSSVRRHASAAVMLDGAARVGCGRAQRARSMSEEPNCRLPACRYSGARDMSKLRLAALIALTAAPAAGAVIFGQQRGVTGKVAVGKPSSSINVAKSEENVLDVPRTEETVRPCTPPPALRTCHPCH